jgi:RNA polymerase sigma-70 factor (ECF subfamily)
MGSRMASVSLETTLPAIGAFGREADGETTGLEQSQALERFLMGVERRAFRIARIAVRNDDDALDIVQEAMIRLARSYGARPTEEWKPLFYRILSNGIRDFMRRRRVRSRIMAWWPGGGPQDGEDFDPIQAAPDPAGGPGELLEGVEALEILEAGLAALPDRQREAFMLRALEGLDVADTAVAMGCSEGSVKTHYFRAVQALKGRLGER